MNSGGGSRIAREVSGRNATGARFRLGERLLFNRVGRSRGPRGGATWTHSSGTPDGRLGHSTTLCCQCWIILTAGRHFGAHVRSLATYLTLGNLLRYRGESRGSSYHRPSRSVTTDFQGELIGVVRRPSFGEP